MVRRSLLLCGVLSPLLYAVADALAGMRRDGYSFRDQTIRLYRVSGWRMPEVISIFDAC
jgi:hypothetical protein